MGCMRKTFVIVCISAWSEFAKGIPFKNVIHVFSALIVQYEFSVKTKYGFV